ncbi:hypothetical protein P9112_014425 [Eukaryota sp. TZLM1-RC]
MEQDQKRFRDHKETSFKATYCSIGEMGSLRLVANYSRILERLWTISPRMKVLGIMNFDLLKIACSSAPEIADDLAHYFQQLIVLKINPPFELLAARLIALVKPGNGIKPDGIRPIAVGESLSCLLASIVFDRVEDKASTFLNPHQFGIKKIDGASVAAIASDTFFNAEENNFIFNLDFKNAFNSVK